MEGAGSQETRDKIDVPGGVTVWRDILREVGDNLICYTGQPMSSKGLQIRAQGE